MSKTEKKQDEEWNKLMGLWKYEVPTPTPTPTPKGESAKLKDQHLHSLITKVKIERALAIITSIIVAVTALRVGIDLVSEIRLGLPSKYDYVFYYSMLILITFMAGGIVWFQRRSWTAHTEHTVDYVQLVLERNAVESKIGKIIELFGFGFLSVLYGVFLWMIFPSLLTGTLVEDLQAIAKPLRGGLILMGGTSLGLVAILFGRWYQRFLANKAKALQEFIKDLE